MELLELMELIEINGRMSFFLNKGPSPPVSTLQPQKFFDQTFSKRFGGTLVITCLTAHLIFLFVSFTMRFGETSDEIILGLYRSKEQIDLLIKQFS
jgi:hypothetical protein